MYTDNNVTHIGGTDYVLVAHFDTAAPCSHCAFLERPWLTCRFPSDTEKRCKCEPGKLHGWKTLEYQKK